MKSAITAPGLQTKHFAVHNVQKGYDDTILGTRTFLKTDYTHGPPPQIGHFGVRDAQFTNADYGPTPGWQDANWYPLWNEPWVKEARLQHNFQVFQGPHSALEMSKFQNWGTYNNHGHANVHPSTKPVPVDRVVEPATLNTVRYF